MIHQRVRGLEITFPGPYAGTFVTISIGVATTIPDGKKSHLDLVHDADVALYRAQGRGGATGPCSRPMRPLPCGCPASQRIPGSGARRSTPVEARRAPAK